MTKTLEISSSNYQSLLKNILQNLKNAEEKITRTKVETAWNIGKLVDNYLDKNREENYGKNLMLRLEQDSKISQKTLYKMQSFYQAYPTLPKDDPKLNWSHYRLLAEIPETNERKYFEKQVRLNDWSASVLQQRLSKNKDSQSEKKPAKKPSKKKSAEPVKLNFKYGKLFTYKLTEIKGRKFLDLGFNIFEEMKNGLAKSFAEGEVVESLKNGENFSLQKSTVSKQEMHTYKAYLERVVDGDTIHVALDLGFNIFHKEILRLAKINAPESDTKEGKVATAELKKILKNVEVLIIKTNKTDIYGRYIADVFLENENGEYLNQTLLDLGVVEVF